MKSTVFIMLIIPVAMLMACGGGNAANDSGQDVGEEDIATDIGTQDPGTPDQGTQDQGTPDQGTQDQGTPDQGTQDPGLTDATPQDLTPDLEQDVDDATENDVPPDVTDPTNIGMNPMYSECGGFEATPRLAAEEPSCGDETLQWEVDLQTDVLTFTNSDVFLNCCGDHDIQVTVQDGVYIITETDMPAAEGGRCFCQCLFDFRIQIPPVDESVIDVRIERVVTDDGAGDAVIVWEGQIDTTPGQGSITIKENVGWCSQGINIGMNPITSGCGGFDAARAAAVEDAGCPDEVLTWQFDDVNQVVAFVNSGVDLNCCGEHEIHAFSDDGVFHIAETDAPADGERCRCMCLFDWAIQVPGVVGPFIDIRLSRDLTDDDLDRGIVWEGRIDISAGSGTITIRKNTGICE